MKQPTSPASAAPEAGAEFDEDDSGRLVDALKTAVSGCVPSFV